MTLRDPSRLLCRTFGAGSLIVTAEAPGRVNIIGEHTDYNDGFVLPFATRESTRIAVRRTATRTVRIVSANLGDPVVRRWPDAPSVGEPSHWPDPILAVIWSLRDLLPRTGGLDIAIVSNVPVGGGLSSSAAVEVATIVALESLFDLDLDDTEVVRHCQRAEAEYVGVQSGVMDPYASLLARDGTALMLDTRTLHHRLVPARLPGVAWAIVDSALPRRLAQSGYNDRRRECFEAMRRIQLVSGFGSVGSLRDVRLCDLDALRDPLGVDLLARVRHVVEENARVLAAAKALASCNAKALGHLLSASHASLRDLYRVSLPEIDRLVDAGLECGALGARIMGGGFGGVTLHLVPTERLDEYVSRVVEIYERESGHRTSVLVVDPSSGARERIEAEASR